MAGVVILLFLRISTEFIRIVERKTWADIHWNKLDPNNPKGHAPTSTEMKIRPVDFF